MGGTSEASTGTEPRPERGTAHLWSAGTTAAGAAFMFVLLRLMAVTHYDWRTAFGLADAIDFGDAVTVVVGTFLGAERITLWLMAFLVPLTAAGHLRHLREGNRSPGSLLVVVALAVVFASAVLSFSAWPALAAALAWFAFLVLVDLRSGPVRRFFHRLVARVGILALAAVLLGAAVVDEVWVPEERIELGDEVVRAHVVQNGSQFLTVLTADTREKRILLSREVTSRTEVD
ncbi:hypothetical protein GCM10007079_27620 [Nocardiopsis terrae]|uniref:Glycosyltransferase RgtA/B/C/D-like domain-containing protein n=1 Tax=Nocardiopsis terrae TaxID=372655 RepID=A0ABR9HF39_9ACTN|nr:hypothetical protein [Nocardiopsis terrae]MBE1457634.1 hypothetical protein [Nocardiopsis terrae]GHC85065.1 hypothetical protein GCM10007079_27620 [Nocardiopsis terrae]